MLKVNKSTEIGVVTVLFMISAGLIFRTQGCPSIYLIPPKEPNLFVGSLISNP